MSAHETVAAELRRRIFTGVYELGSRLPALWRIGDELGVTEPVAGRAVADLKRAGLLRSVPGVGVWVVDEIPDTAMMQAALDAARGGIYLAHMWQLDYEGDDAETELVTFPAAWIQRLLDERASLASRLAECGCADTMASSRNS